MSEIKTLTQDQIDGLDRKEFQTYAQEAFGISLDARKSKDDMVQAFLDAGGKIAESDAPGAPENPKAQNLATANGEVDINEADPKKYPKHDVTIHGQEGPGGGDDVFLSVNGHALLIKRNERVSIPWPHLEALKNAVRTETSQKVVGGEIMSIKRQVQVHAFTDHGPSEA